jgi:hypothetical protein
MVESETTSPEALDVEIDRVFNAVNLLPKFPERCEIVVRQAVDDVLRGDTTARFSISDLAPEEKKHIGTKVEHGLRREFFENRKGAFLDTTVEDVEVDIKNTIGNTWMIPPEAVDKLCLLSAIDESSEKFSIGLVRANASLLTKPNQDRKRSLSKKGRETIRWFVKNRALRVSIFVSDPEIRQAVFSKGSGQTRVAELFRQVKQKPIQRTDIEIAAAHEGRQIDVRARVRDARNKLSEEGLRVLRGWNPGERNEAQRRGYTISKTQCITLNADSQDQEAVSDRYT